ncbi:PTS system mannose/fructose/N-acetylgalactosamine-transporter subunit IIB [Streptococcus marmotae]|uniref:PTS system mannose/fructose/N-acetylgalactosamine-transporter subunit IIB n=1 Tax=Streptococcus marmotae TaxID=1825069 RepID=UPI00082E24FD|nr:PTS sugar transporter subunit IIB [Streptococcus marmotae]
MGLVLARVDQRLVHGIVVTQVVKDVNAKRIMVIDDLVSQDEDQKNIIRMSKPAGTGMSIINVETAITNIKAGKYDDHNVLIVVNSPKILLNLADAGIKLPKVQLGIVFDREDREKLTKSVSLNDEEKNIVKELSSRGIEVVFQFTPNSKEEPLNKYVY